MPAEMHAPGADATLPAAPSVAARALRRRVAAGMWSGAPTIGPLERALALRTLPLFHAVRPRQLGALAQHMREYVAGRGKVVYAAGEPPNRAHVLIDGRVRLQRDGRRIGNVDAPAALGLVDLLAGVSAQATVIAETDIAALVVDEAALLDVLEEHFSMVLHLHAALVHEIVVWRERVPDGEPARPEDSAELARTVVPAGLEFDLVNGLLCLQRAPELRMLGVAVLAALLRDHQPLRFQAGDELFAQGAPASQFLVIVDGEVQCTRPPERRGFRARAGGVLGRAAALAGMPYGYTAVAETAGAAIGIQGQVFWDVAEDHFHVARAALSWSARQLLALQTRAAQAGAESATGANP